MSQGPQSDELQLQEDANPKLSSDSKSSDRDVDSLEQTDDDHNDGHDAAEFCRPGDIVGRHFEVISVLGGGGQSVVYKARHLSLDKVYAVKVMLPNRVPNEKQVRRFQQEAKAVSKLNHPAIVKVHEFDIDGAGRPYIVMDYVEGQPLSSMIHERGALSSNQVFQLLSQAADALSVAHGTGIVHRDIKPSNIIVVTEDNGSQSIRLVDFGIAKVTVPEADNDTLTSTGEVMGSPLYMSPEQCLGKPVDVRTDIYSLGCVLYECLTGKPPFEGGSFLEVLMAHVQQPLRITDQRVSGASRTIVERCLAKEPDARYRSMPDLKKDFEKAAIGSPLDYATPAAAPTGEIKRLRPRDAEKNAKQREKLLYLLLFPAIFLIAMWAGSEYLKSKMGTVPDLKVPQVPMTSGSFRPGGVPPHVSAPITAWSTAYQKADRYYYEGQQLWGQRQYQKAIEDLKICTATYKENGTNYGNPDIETAYLGEAYYYLYLCHKGLDQQSEAAASLREAVRLFWKINLIDDAKAGATGTYMSILHAAGRGYEADMMATEAMKTGKITQVP